MERVRINRRPEDSLADDLLWGAEAIARYIGRDKEQVFYLIRKNKIPYKKVGQRIQASKTAFRRFFEGEGCRLGFFSVPVVAKRDLKKNLQEQAKYEAIRLRSDDLWMAFRQRAFAEAIKLLGKRSRGIPSEVRWMVQRFGLLDDPDTVSEDVIRMACAAERMHRKESLPA